MEEIWKDVVGYEGLYQVSSFGNVKSLHFTHLNKEKILKFKMSADGYPMVGLSKNGISQTIMVHKLVAIHFLNHKPNGVTMVINHKNFIRNDNRVENIEIITQRENTNRKHLKHSSIYTGVLWHPKSKKWQTNICINGIKKHLGLFTDEFKAHLAYKNELNKLEKPVVQ